MVATASIAAAAQIIPSSLPGGVNVHPRLIHSSLDPRESAPVQRFCRSHWWAKQTDTDHATSRLLQQQPAFHAMNAVQAGRSWYAKYWLAVVSWKKCYINVRNSSLRSVIILSQKNNYRNSGKCWPLDCSSFCIICMSLSLLKFRAKQINFDGGSKEIKALVSYFRQNRYCLLCVVCWKAWNAAGSSLATERRSMSAAAHHLAVSVRWHIQHKTC